jgi:hypothetical protein
LIPTLSGGFPERHLSISSNRYKYLRQCNVESPRGAEMEKPGAGFRTVLCEYTANLGAPDDFLYGVLEEHMRSGDDWSLIIKLHALLESACIEALTRDLGQPCEKFIGSLRMGRDSGRISLMSALGLLSPEQAQFCFAFGALRNRLVHAVRNTSISLGTSFASDPKFTKVADRLEKFVVATLPKSTFEGNVSKSALQIWKDSPALALHWTMTHTLHAVAHAWYRRDRA